jgi:hypothetical protein
MCASTPSCPVCGTTAEFAALHLHLQTDHRKSDVSRALLHEIAPYPPTDLSFFLDDADGEPPATGFKGAGTAVWDGGSGRETSDDEEEPHPGGELPPA